ncbi:MAG: hypothetical protein IJY19_06690 [Ruminococcus sp.]|nr:hypothetical protein [Ruminococcus sp.]
MSSVMTSNILLDLWCGKVGSGYDVLAGGAINENLGEIYELGANIGSIVGGTIRSFAYGKLTPRH